MAKDKKKMLSGSLNLKQEVMEPQIQRYKELGYAGYVNFMTKVEMMSGKDKKKATNNAFMMAGMIKKILSKGSNSVKTSYNRNRRK